MLLAMGSLVSFFYFLLGSMDLTKQTGLILTTSLLF